MNLLEALQDPTRKTTACLEKLLQTKFVHVVDAPSLALIMPVIQRAFQDRTTDTRKMAAQIMGNMYSLTDQKVRSCSLCTHRHMGVCVRERCTHTHAHMQWPFPASLLVVGVDIIMCGLIRGGCVEYF